MYKSVCVSLCLVITVSAIPLQHHSTVVEPETQASHLYATVIDSYEDDFGGNGAELASLAHTSAQKAKNAAHSQHSAGSQAAYGAKSSLATIAAGAAQTAQAALTAKKAIVSSIKRQLIEAQNQLKEEIAQHRHTQAAARAAQETAHQAQAQLDGMAAAQAAAQSNAQHSAAAAEEAAKAEAVQKSMVIEAKQKIGQLVGQLKVAYAHLQETEAAAHKATHAAHVAHANAESAAPHFQHPQKWFY